MSSFSAASKHAAPHHKNRFSTATKPSYYKTCQQQEAPMGLTKSLNALAVGLAFLFVAMMLFI
jgi:hypothetical protein